MSAPVEINGKRYIESGEVRLKDLNVGDFFRIKSRGASVIQVVSVDQTNCTVRGTDLKEFYQPGMSIVKHLKPF